MRSTSAAFASSLLAYFLVAACGGKTLAGGDGTNPGSGGATTGGGGGAGSSTTGGTGGSCVNIELSAYDTSCVQNTDCISVNVGQVCAGACLCGGGGAIATSSQTQYNAALSSIQTNDTCSCPGPGPVACVQGQCTQCSFGPSDPLGCPGNDSDGGFDTGIAVEGGEQTDSSEGDCVNVDLSTYDTSCSQDSDCTVIWAGVLCPSSFERCVLLYCRGFSAVSTSEYGRYMAAISPITSADYDASVPLGCSCPAFPHAICASGQCTSCAPLSTVGGCAERDGG
jgi:hypothetical protein